MYPRIVARKNKDGSVRRYIYLSKSVRVGKKVVQKNMGNLGRLDDFLEGNDMRNVIEKLAKLHPVLHEKLIIADASEMSRKTAQLYGPLLVLRTLWNELGLGTLLGEFFKSSKAQLPISEAVFAMVCNRLIEPSSKRGTAAWLETVYEPQWESLELHHLYRSMDALVKHKEDIEIKMAAKLIDLFKVKVDMILFDTTSIMSWGEGEHADMLKHGHSKEKRPDLKQIMVGVLMSQDGIPIGHEVWDGNQNDKKSFAHIIKKVKTKYSLGQVILVGDRGMISSKNIQALEEEGLGYILGLPMRQLSQEKRQELLGFDGAPVETKSGLAIPGFELVKATDEGKLYAKDKTLIDTHTGLRQRYVICYNPNEAMYEAQKRAYFKEILQKKVDYSTVKSWIVKNGYRKYLTLEGHDGSDVIVKVDEDRLKSEAIYDGKWVLTTNTTLDQRDIARAYKSLSQVEQAFRELKSNIEVGPMYHWTDNRIKAHIFICFLALTLQIVLQKKLKRASLDLSVSQAIDALKTLDVSRVSFGEKTFNITSDPSLCAKAIFQSLGLQLPKRVL